MGSSHSALSLLLSGSLLIAMAGCGKAEAVKTGSSLLGSGDALTVATRSVQVVAAGAADCPAGGWILQLFTDINFNGAYDDQVDTLVSSSKVCNGAVGPQGNSVGIRVAAASPAACPAGGTVFTTYVETPTPTPSGTNPQTLESDSIGSVTTICNGLPGANGVNGSSARISVTPASVVQCPTGGAVYSTGLEGEAQTATVVCNGANGSNGTNGTNGTNGQDASFQMGAVGPAVSGKNYSACHHDYVYLPGTEEARGWLLFRHQRNGAEDQGIGSTGFQVWNVDITDFLLASEVGAVTYCQMRWDPAAKLLTYQVIDNTDRLAWTRGEIQLR